LDRHFNDNNDVRKKKQVNPSKSESRPLFNSFAGWIKQGPGDAGQAVTDPTEAQHASASKFTFHF
jgi:hypothetical protein